MSIEMNAGFEIAKKIRLKWDSGAKGTTFERNSDFNSQSYYKIHVINF